LLSWNMIQSLGDVCCLTNIKLNEREARDAERAIEWRKDDVSVHSLRRRIIWLWYYPQDLCSSSFQDSSRTQSRLKWLRKRWR
jgi:hypothetical protein